MTVIESIFAWIEATPLSLWVRGESLLAFPLILVVHTIGMGFLAGASAVVALRVLGLASGIPLPSLEKFYPVIWAGFAANLGSGLLLLAGYPYKAFSNPVFYVKLSFIALGLFMVLKLRNDVLRVHATGYGRGKILAVVSLLCWVGAIGAGRLLAYTYTWLRVGVRLGF